jgi:hypothetical protein
MPEGAGIWRRGADAPARPVRGPALKPVPTALAGSRAAPEQEFSTITVAATMGRPAVTASRPADLCGRAVIVSTPAAGCGANAMAWASAPAPTAVFESTIARGVN